MGPFNSAYASLNEILQKIEENLRGRDSNPVPKVAKEPKLLKY